MPPCDGVMLIGFGGPTEPEEVRPFLDRVLRDRPIGTERYEAVVHHYEAIGGYSPYNECTLRQAHALAAELVRMGDPIPVTVGMRNWAPFLADTLADLGRQRARRVVGFILSAFQCEASWERYQDAIADARSRLPAAPIVNYTDPWHEHPLFIEAVAARTRDALAQMSPADRSKARLVFTAHSIPAAMAAASPYVGQLTESARRVAVSLGVDRWTIAFQSRSGNPRDSWLEPDIAEVIHSLAGGAAVIVPIGFLCDHLEVLYDLDVDAAAVAREHDVRLVRAGTVGDHPAFIAMMAEAVRAVASHPETNG